MKVLYDAQEIARAVWRLAFTIAADHRRKPLVLLGVLKGALPAVVDLARDLSAIPDGPSKIEVEYICLASYGRSTQSSGEVRLLLDTRLPMAGKYVVAIDDIADGGLTMQRVRALIQERGPARLRTCAVFERTDRRGSDFSLDYVGLPVPGTFVVGYGLDYREKYRNLPYLAELPPELLSQEG